jgi:hypothetical protein
VPFTKLWEKKRKKKEKPDRNYESLFLGKKTFSTILKERRQQNKRSKTKDK